MHTYYDAADPDALLARLSGLAAVVTDGARGVEQRVLESLPGVELVTVFGVGVDAVALDYCKKQRIRVTNTPDVLSADVADLALALMLTTARNMIAADHYCRSGDWSRHGAMPLTTRVSDKRAGIFGMGSIGLQLARRLEAFNMPVSYCNRNKRSDVNYEYIADLTTLAMEVDFLIVAASASASTDRIIGTDVLQALGPDGYLINISRGSLVDEAALVQALEKGTIKGAGLDVFDNEPDINPRLLTLDNVVLQPHQASATYETRKAMGQVVLENLECFFDQRPLKTEYFIRG